MSVNFLQAIKDSGEIVLPNQPHNFQRHSVDPGDSFFSIASHWRTESVTHQMLDPSTRQSGKYPRVDAGGLGREYVLRVPSVS